MEYSNIFFQIFILKILCKQIFQKSITKRPEARFGAKTHFSGG
jgi:hypothetical protein